MKLLVVGASGGLGRQLVEQALADGHQVSAFVRNPEAFQIQHSALTVVRGDIMKPETVEPALEGHDVVLSAAGGSLGATTIYSQGIGNVITAMEKQGIRRFICVTSAGISDEDAATQGFSMRRYSGHCFSKMLMQICSF